MSALAGAICTKATDCKAASSCCSAFSKTSGGAAQGTTLVCWAAGTAAKTKQTIPVVAPITANDLDSGTSGYLVAACAAAATGASALAVSAAAAATAVYMM